jgi:hypothetical protein
MMGDGMISIDSAVNVETLKKLAEKYAIIQLDHELMIQSPHQDNTVKISALLLKKLIV